MLFKQAILEKIRRGEVRLAFRRWRRPTVKPGGRLRTAIGELAIDALEPVAADAITEKDAQLAGFADRDALLAELAKLQEGELYRIAFHLAGPDARDALREDDDLSEPDIAAIASRLEHLDAHSSPWTHSYLRLIADNPGVAASALADAAGVEKALFKRRVRRLKALGLTESLPTGYRLSRRGRRFLERVREI
jgi:hypothetical protein